MSMPYIEQLIEAHLEFLDEEFSQSKTIQTEFLQFYHWFRKQSLQDIWSFEQINHLIQKQSLATPASHFLIEQIAEHIRFALIHPVNDDTKIEDIIPVTTIDKIALYVASKSAHRQALIKQIVNNPSFSTMLTQLIHHSIQDYIDNSVMNKKVLGVGRFMKMGKSVLESVTDTNLDDTVKHYLQKNIIKISQLSEQVLNQQFDDNKLYHFQANLWHKIKKVPLSTLRNYVEVKDLPKTVGLGHEVWEHLRQTDYLKKQVHDGVYAWYVRNQERNFDLLLRDLNIDETLVQNELQALLEPVIKNMLSSQHLKTRARYYLEKFYYSEKAQAVFTQIEKGV
ncbi:hypothetical protein [Acinetobacter sp. ANC 3832]|uniref:hypothetical protein n=1 Tax=Acinetobacter sp. ANC 3832 TaxID=1977874 RepID=UPI000A350B37|nr:hypothetical protein [Acinetobacter sp. ANC 3832]OTG93037.1 hypothetical protein B9T35_10860 [Acinetobacter sp. ANC 3832]